MRHSGPSLIALGLVLLVACGGMPAETTPSSSPPETATTKGAPLTADAVALAFFEAWQSGDRRAMERLSEPAALNEADRLVDLATGTWRPGLCEGAAGTVYCTWISDGGTLAIGVRNIEEPHLVTSFGLLDP